MKTYGINYIGYPSTDVYEYKTDLIDFSNFVGYNIDYCTLNGLSLDLVVLA